MEKRGYGSSDGNAAGMPIRLRWSHGESDLHKAVFRRTLGGLSIPNNGSWRALGEKRR